MKLKTVFDSNISAPNANSLKVGRLIFMRHYFSNNMSLAPVPYILSILGFERTLRDLANVAIIALSVFTITLLAQIVFPLPWTPVPVTGQTFGVLLISLLMGRNRAFIAVATYLFIGAMGYPVFALGKSGIVLGPTTGYLVGMLLSSFVVGWLSDRGWSQRFSTCVMAGLISSVIVFGFGIFVLSYFTPQESLFMAGFLPFIPGDIVKITLAALLVAPVSHGLRKI